MREANISAALPNRAFKQSSSLMYNIVEFLCIKVALKYKIL